VSRVSSSNLSSIDDDGELLVFLLGALFEEAAPFVVSTRHVRTNARETEDQV
jgi:hypothetical protein